MWLQDEIPSANDFENTVPCDIYPPNKADHNVIKEIFPDTLITIYKSENRNLLIYYIKNKSVKVKWLMIEKSASGMITEPLSFIETGYMPNVLNVQDNSIEWQIQQSPWIKFTSLCIDNQWQTCIEFLSPFETVNTQTTSFSLLYLYMFNNYLPFTHIACGVDYLFFVFEEHVLGIKLASINNLL